MAKNELTIGLPELGLVAATRTLLGAGMALLHADRLNSEQRKAVGWTLTIVGVAISIPVAFVVLGGGRLRREREEVALPETAEARRKAA
jgi:hypothetical protein